VVEGALARAFTGHRIVQTQTHEMLDDDFLDALLVPSNQEEFLSEITDRSLREEVIRELMLGEILPAMQEQGAGTGSGLNVRWTVGSFVR
jgi:hypothetical protein